MQTGSHASIFSSSLAWRGLTRGSRHQARTPDHDDQVPKTIDDISLSGTGDWGS